MGKFTKKLVAVLVIMTMVLASASIAFAADDSPATKPAAAAKITSFYTDCSSADKTITAHYAGKNCTKYEVAYRVQGGSWKTVTTTKKSYKITGLKNNSLYQVRVRGINKDGKKGAWSATKSRYIGQVKSFKVTSPKKGQIKVTGSKMSGVAYYQIKYSKKSSMKNAKTVTCKSATLNKTIKNLKKGTYYVQVRPVKTVGGKNYIGSYQTKKKVTVK